MNPNVWWVILFAAVIGHFGINVAIYNRLNGLGLPRRMTKHIEHFFAVLAVLIPIAMLWMFRDTFWDMLQGRPNKTAIPSVLWYYGAFCLASWIFLGIPWLLWRPIFGIEWIQAPRETEIVNVRDVTDHPLALSIKCKLECDLPLNQIFDLAIDKISLPVAGLPPALDGYRIAQFSDVHLTGDIHADFTKYVVQRATDWQPNMIALSGDVIDSQKCVSWLYDIFSPAQATDGCYFILGNHDTRIVNPADTRGEMERAGWIDVSQKPVARELAGVSSLIIGNEAPWFPLPDLGTNEADFRVLLSHGPDQIHWARKHDVHLMMAGHTHGGQGRLPLLGPILSPSLHGSRYASGDFYKAPTTLHVSRGLSGTHLLRINCRPQLSLLTLKAV